MEIVTSFLYPSPAGFAAGPNGVFFVSRIAESTLSLPIAIGTGAGSPKFLHLQTGVDKKPGTSIISTPVRRLTVTLTLPPLAGDNKNPKFRKALLQRTQLLLNPFFQETLHPNNIR